MAYVQVNVVPEPPKRLWKYTALLPVTLAKGEKEQKILWYEDGDKKREPTELIKLPEIGRYKLELNFRFKVNTSLDDHFHVFMHQNDAAYVAEQHYSESKRAPYYWTCIGDYSCLVTDLPAFVYFFTNATTTPHLLSLLLLVRMID